MMKNVLDWLEAAALQAPSAPAFDMPSRRISWSETHKRAREIGSCLAEHIEAGQPVLILMDKSPDCIAAMLGAAYAGCFYTPLDSTMPQKRMQMIAEVLQPAAVICEERYAELAGRIAPEAVCFTEALIPQEENTALLSARMAAQIDTDLLYVLFTSGSTGTPKGVAITHRSVIDLIDWACRELRLPQGCRFGSQAPFYFDNSVLDIYCAMKMRGSLFLIPKTAFMFPAKLLTFLQTEEIDTIFWVPSALTAVAHAKVLGEHSPLPALKRIFFCGEVMPCRTLNCWRQAVPDADFVNMYGPTEITDVCTWYRVDRAFDDGDVLPIGHPCDNTRIDLINGEICVSGSCLSVGYYNAPDKTAAAFVQNPLRPQIRELVYKTGDLGAYNERGELMFCGRRDGQIKRSGYRIELGEIESALLALPGVGNGCCIYDAAKEKIVCAWIGIADKAAIRQHLKDAVPKYMLPDVWLHLTQLPYTGSGKIDRIQVMHTYEDEYSEL